MVLGPWFSNWWQLEALFYMREGLSELLWVWCTSTNDKVCHHWHSLPKDDYVRVTVTVRWRMESVTFCTSILHKRCTWHTLHELSSDHFSILITDHLINSHNHKKIQKLQKGRLASIFTIHTILTLRLHCRQSPVPWPFLISTIPLTNTKKHTTQT